MVSFASNERLLAQSAPIIYEEEEEEDASHSRLFRPQNKQPSPKRRPGNNDGEQEAEMLSRVPDDDDDDDDSSREPLNPQYHRWSEEDYLRNVVPWESLEQKAYVDTLLERRAHYKAIRVWVGVTCTFAILIGWIAFILYARWSGEDFRWGPVWGWKNSGAGAGVAKLTAGVLVLICAPLWLTYESRTKEEMVDAELQRLTKKRLLLVEPSLPQTSSWDPSTRSRNHRRTNKQKKCAAADASS